MRCEEVEVLIQRHLDQDLSKEEHLSLQQHVTQCSDCQQLLDELLHISDQLTQLPKVDPPYSIVDSILPQLGLDHSSAQPIVADISRTSEGLPKAKRKIHQKKRFWIPSSIVAAGLFVLLLTSNFPGSNGVSNELADNGMHEFAGLSIPNEKSSEPESTIASLDDSDAALDDNIMMFTVPDTIEEDAEDVGNQKMIPREGANHRGGQNYGIDQPEFEEGIVSPSQNYIAYLGYRYEDIRIDKINQLTDDGQIEQQVPHHVTRKLLWESPWHVTQLVWVEDNQLYVVLYNDVSEQEEFWLLTVTERGAEEEQLEEAYQIN